jgi:hypothetical protein
VSEPAPSSVEDLASGCVRAVRDAVGFELDYTPDTLAVVDHWISLAETESGAVLDLLAPMAGAYFGEVVRRALPSARWHAPAGDLAGYRIEFEDVFLCVNPIGVAREAFSRAEAPGFGAHLRMDEADRRAVEESLAALGEIAEDDYYRLVVRFEVLEQAYETLRVRGASKKGTTPHFGPELYAATYDAELDPTRRS